MSSLSQLQSLGAAPRADLFAALPEDCVLHITGLLTDARDALSVQAACRRWRQLARSSRVWPDLLKQDFGVFLKVRLQRCQVDNFQAQLEGYG